MLNCLLKVENIQSCEKIDFYDTDGEDTEDEDLPMPGKGRRHKMVRLKDKR